MAYRTYITHITMDNNKDLILSINSQILIEYHSYLVGIVHCSLLLLQLILYPFLPYYNINQLQYILLFITAIYHI